MIGYNKDLMFSCSSLLFPPSHPRYSSPTTFSPNQFHALSLFLSVSLFPLNRKQKMKPKQKIVKETKPKAKSSKRHGICLGQLVLGMGPALEWGWYAQCHFSRTSECSQQVSIANDFAVRMPVCLLPFLCAGFSMVRVCMFMCVLPQWLSSYVHQSCCVWETLLPQRHPSLWLLQSSCLLHRPLSFEDRALKTSHSGLSTSKSLTLCTSSRCGSLLLLMDCKKTILC